MDYGARVNSLVQQSHELDLEFSGLKHRVRRLGERQDELKLLRASVAEAKEELIRAQKGVAAVQEKLPLIARKEELEQFEKRLDAMPFESFVRSKVSVKRQVQLDEESKK